MSTSSARSLRALAPLAVALVALGGCNDRPLAYGDPNSIIAVMDPAVWAEVGDDVYAALEPTIRTVRAEKTFTVTYQEPGGEFWGDLRRFRQILVVGTGQEPWMQEALAEARDSVTGPGIYTAYNVWSSGQQVTIVVGEEGGLAEELRRHLPAVNEVLDEQYRRWARNRMYMTKPDSALADTLMTRARFQMLLPRVYRWSADDSLYLFINDNPDPSELIRQVAVTWRTPVPSDMQPETILAWRAEVAARYSVGQEVVLDHAEAGPFEYRGRPAYQIQAVWKNPPESNWPAGGPFITRAVICPNQNRMYLLDAWLYAPGKEKYEYMIQLETILDSFRCGLS